MLRKDLLRVSRAGGGYQPQFVAGDDDAQALASRVMDTYRDHIEDSRGELEAALTDLERTATDFKLVRGFAYLLEQEATFETRAPVDPVRARRAAFEASEDVGVVTEHDRHTALQQAGDRLNVTSDAVAASLYADRETNQILTDFDPRWEPALLCEQYDLSLAATALFDATELRVQSSEPKALISTVKRLRLLYEIRRTDTGREVVITGPDALFRRSRRYGTRFAQLLRTVASAASWSLSATIDDRGTDRTLRLSEADLSVPGTAPTTEMTFDSGIEADFAARFRSLDLEWELLREPEPLAAGEHVVIPDFAFDWKHGDFRVFFEIMGFWTPAYVEKKLSRFRELEDVAFLVAVDESLGVGEEVSALTDGAIPYTGRVRVKDVVDALREFEADLVATAAATLPDELVPQTDVVTLAELAETHDVSEAALADVQFPDHERVGRTLIRPAVLIDLRNQIEPGMDLTTATEIITTHGIDDASAALAAVGYRVEWEGLSGGTVRARSPTTNPSR